MIDLKSLELGDMIYSVSSKGHLLDRKRLEFTDAEGNVWHRYDKPFYTYFVREWEVSCIIHKTIYGTPEYESFDDVIEIRATNDGYVKDFFIPKNEEELKESSQDLKIYFYTREEAQAAVDQENEKENARV